MRPMYENSGCSTVIIGKNVSATGHVLVAHSEDDPNCYIQTHLVPRIKHQPGETITFSDGTAVIPQVEETYALYWSELRSLNGMPFADGFFNEWGVSVVSNGCNGCKSPVPLPVSGGLGYGLRRLIAERARSAREGVEIAAALLDQFGYRSARAYIISDRDEAWVLQVVAGHNYVAQRVGDDEILYIPNWYTIRQVDFSDVGHKRFYWSKDLVAFAMEHGYYTPAKVEDFSDFDFADAYQDPKGFTGTNISRNDLAWPALVGRAVPQRTFSVKAERTYTRAELMDFLRLHARNKEEGRSPHFFDFNCGICWTTTVESSVIEFAEDPALTCIWRATCRPCSSPFIPWYMGLTAIPQGYESIEHAAALASHFLVGESELRPDSRMAFWDFHTLQNVREMNLAFAPEVVEEGLAQLEEEWAFTKAAVDEAYRRLVPQSPTAARALLTDYTAAQAQKARRWAHDTAQTILTKNDAINVEPYLS